MSDDKKVILGYFGIWLQSWVVCDCKNSRVVSDCENYLQCVIAKAAGLFLWLQKRKRKTEPVCDCNYLACVIATRSYVCCKKTWLCLCACKATWLFGIWLQAWIVCDCKKLKCVIAKSASLFLWLQKRKRKTEPVCDCNYLACVIATRSYVCCKKNLTLSVCLQSYLVIWNMIASLDSVWLQKTKVCDCKICWFISVTAKKRKTEPVCDCNYLACVIATRSYVCCKKKPDFVCVLAKLLGYLEYDCKPGGSVKLQKVTWLFGIWLQACVVCDCKNLLVYFCDCKKEKENWTSVWLQLVGVRDCNQELCVVARKHDFVCEVEKLLGYLEYDCKPG
jgi:hypothetical protein